MRIDAPQYLSVFLGYRVKCSSCPTNISIAGSGIGNTPNCISVLANIDETIIKPKIYIITSIERIRVFFIILF